jgi:hypothetical protein
VDGSRPRASNRKPSRESETPQESLVFYLLRAMSF